MTLDEIVFRELRPEDSIPAITQLLHEAYRPLAEQGFRFHASHQSEEITRERLNSGYPIIAELEGKIIGTITAYGPKASSPCLLYCRNDVNSFGQFAVRRDLQGLGIGGRLFRLAEEFCRRRGARIAALDTAEGATHLRNWYERLGYQVIDYMQWEVTNYRSVVMAKDLKAVDLRSATS